MKMEVPNPSFDILAKIHFPLVFCCNEKERSLFLQNFEKIQCYEKCMIIYVVEFSQ